jgi:hypothetical protein
MRGKIIVGLILGGLALYFLWGPARSRAQNDRSNRESVHLIDSIQGGPLYKAYCAACHGNGTYTRWDKKFGRFVPAIRGVSLAATATPEYLQKNIENGRPGTQMPAWGPFAQSLKVPPSDLTRIAARNGGTFPLARMERIISGEEEVPGGHGTREMPVWGPIFSQVGWDRDLGRVRIDNLARYLRDMQEK